MKLKMKSDKIEKRENLHMAHKSKMAMLTKIQPPTKVDSPTS
jgi:hypothetical protein